MKFAWHGQLSGMACSLQTSRCISLQNFEVFFVLHSAHNFLSDQLPNQPLPLSHLLFHLQVRNCCSKNLSPNFLICLHFCHHLSPFLSPSPWDFISPRSLPLSFSPLPLVLSSPSHVPLPPKKRFRPSPTPQARSCCSCPPAQSQAPCVSFVAQAPKDCCPQSQGCNSHGKGHFH